MGGVQCKNNLDLHFYALQSSLVHSSSRSRCSHQCWKPVQKPEEGTKWTLCIKCMLPADNQFYAIFFWIEWVLVSCSLLFLSQLVWGKFVSRSCWASLRPFSRFS